MLSFFSVALPVSAITVAFGGLIYRSTGYWLIPVTPGDPYGLGDVLELVIAAILFGLALGCLAITVVHWFRRRSHFERRWYSPGVLGGAAALTYFSLHPYMPRLL